MPTKFQVVAGLVATAVAYDLATRPFRRKYAQLARLFIETSHEKESLETQMAYLVNVLNENNVALDEFDLIVLTNVERQS